MAKKKIVIKVLLMETTKMKAKAMKIVVGISGVESAIIGGDNKDQIEIIGEEVDPTRLTILLRKRFCHVELVSVGPVKNKEEKKKKEKKKKEEAIVSWSYGVPTAPYYQCYPVCVPYEEPSCSIL